MKKRVAFWGITEDILNVIRDEIDPRKVEIVAFIDSDEKKHGSLIMGVPVISLFEIQRYSIDIYLISALRSYCLLKQVLLDAGIENDYIQPFITKDLRRYKLGDLTEMKMNFIDELYFEPEKRLKELEEYIFAWKKYSEMPSIVPNENEWNRNCSLIAHACGGYVNGKQIMYSNSKEALLFSLDNHFNVIECDVILDCDVLILAHDYFRFYESMETNYTMMSIKDILSIIKDYPDVNLLIDVKWDNENDYLKSVNKIEEVVRCVCSNMIEQKQLKNQLILEVYNESTIEIANKLGYKMFFTQYRNECCFDVLNIAVVCGKYGISTVGIWPEYVEEVNLELLTDKGIDLFVYSSDSIAQFKYLRMKGVKGIFTNYLTEDIVNDKQVLEL